MSAWKRYHVLHHPTCYCVIVHIQSSNFIAYFDLSTWLFVSIDSICLSLSLRTRLYLQCLRVSLTIKTRILHVFVSLVYFPSSTNNTTIHKFTILSNVAYKTTHANTSTSKNTKACTSMSTQSSGNTMQLFTIVSPFATMFDHVTFK